MWVLIICLLIKIRHSTSLAIKIQSHRSVSQQSVASSQSSLFKFYVGPNYFVVNILWPDCISCWCLWHLQRLEPSSLSSDFLLPCVRSSQTDRVAPIFQSRRQLPVVSTNQRRACDAGTNHRPRLGAGKCGQLSPCSWANGAIRIYPG